MSPEEEKQVHEKELCHKVVSNFEKIEKHWKNIEIKNQKLSTSLKISSLLNVILLFILMYP